MDGKAGNEGFGEVIEELRKTPLTDLFLVKSDWLGSAVALAALKSHGWQGERIWRQNKDMWFEKRLETNAGALILRLCTGPVMPSPIPSGCEGVGLKSGFAYLRAIRVFRERNRDGDREGLADSEEAADLLASELPRCGELAGRRFWEDLEQIAKNKPVPELPPGIPATPFAIQLRILAGVLATNRQRHRGHLDERLLVRMVRALAEPEYDPAGRAQLNACADGITLADLFCTWAFIPCADEAGNHLLAYALERAEAGLVAPYPGMAWCALSAWLRRQGYFWDATVAAERAAEWPGAGEMHVRALWSSILEHVQAWLGCGCPDPDGMKEWLGVILSKHENLLGGREGYRVLRAIAASRGETGD